MLRLGEENQAGMGKREMKTAGENSSESWHGFASVGLNAPCLFCDYAKNKLSAFWKGVLKPAGKQEHSQLYLLDK